MQKFFNATPIHTFSIFFYSRGVAIRMTECKYNLPSFNSLNHAVFFPQNLPSVIVGHLMDIKADDAVLDMCAAPGKPENISYLCPISVVLYSILFFPFTKQTKKDDRMQQYLRRRPGDKNLFLFTLFACFFSDRRKINSFSNISRKTCMFFFSNTPCYKLPPIVIFSFLNCFLHHFWQKCCCL